MTAAWKDLGKEIWSRMKSIADPPRLMYFVVVVVGIGGLGAWQSTTADALAANLTTYAMGIAAAAAVELVLPDESSRSMRMFALSLGTFAVAASLVYNRLPTSVSSAKPLIVWAAPSFAWLLWILSASTNVNIGSPDPVAATGGNTNEIAGDTSDFQT